MLVLLALVASAAQAFTSPLVEKFKKDGLVTAIAPCEYKKESLTCMLVEMKGEKWIVIGTPTEGKFIERYILKLQGEVAKEVWAHTWRES